MKRTVIVLAACAMVVLGGVLFVSCSGGKPDSSGEKEPPPSAKAADGEAIRSPSEGGQPAEKAAGDVKVSEKGADAAAKPEETPTAKPEETPAAKPDETSAAALRVAQDGGTELVEGAAGPDEKPGDEQPAALALDTQKKKVSYCLGLSMVANLKGQTIEVDTEALAQGIRDSLPGGTRLLSEKEVGEIMKAFQQEMMAKRKAEMAKRMADMRKKQELAARNAPESKRKGEVFLAENAKRPGVVTLPSGLQYKIVRKGAGRTPTTADTVVCHYRGTFIDGREFDSSYKRGKPAEFPVTGVISGWTEALQLMKVGGKWKLYIPSDLAYGPRGRGSIGPNETLIFDIELLGIK